MVQHIFCFENPRVRMICVGRNLKDYVPTIPSQIQWRHPWIFLTELQLVLGWGWLPSLLLWLSKQGLPLLWHLFMEKVTAQLRIWNGHSLESSILHPTNTHWQLVTSGIQDRRHHRKYSYTSTVLFRNVKRCCCQQEETLNYEFKYTQ